MRIKLLRLYSSPEIFKSIDFTDGINLIMGEKVENESVKKGKKTNGVGKSMCIEFINFCLLKKTSDSRVSKIPLDKFMEDTQIILDLEINSNFLKIIRTKHKSNNPVIVKDGVETEFSSIEDANQYLKELLFSDIDNVTLGFREFLGPFVRDEESEYKDILSCYDLSKRIPPSVKPHAFLFGFDISIINSLEKLFKEIEKVNAHKLQLQKSLTENKTRKIRDVKAVLNSLNDDLRKIDTALDSFKTNEAYEVMQEDLGKIQLEIENLRARQTALKYELKKVKSFPSLEVIKRKEIEIVYEQFKSGLGEIVSKSIDEVVGFKEKIDEFQKRLLVEKVTSLEEELDIVTTKLQNLENSKVDKLKVIDQKGVLKDIKNGYAIYHQKRDSYSNLQNTYEAYDNADSDWKKLRLEKDQMFLKLDAQIFDARTIIENFNDTIVEIHSYIMDSNEASFDIKTVNESKNKQILSFDMRIDDDGSHSIDRTKVFIYDLALLFNEYTNKRHPKFLIHDNIFDVDQDTLIKSLNYLSKKESQKFQYILTLNRDKIENEEQSKLLELDIKEHRVANFTKKDRFLYGDKYSEL
ncbi:MAG: hypothetical protein ACD_19C00032G0003 [uncultured bacterium]|nr:MAG: hypothetical protein ACD_19C00032G0003 [uncultured bacterium]